MKGMIKYIINGEPVYLKKGLFGYRIIYPPKNEDGNINWLNFIVGGKANLIKLIFVGALIVLLYFGVSELISQYQTIVADPCSFCTDCFTNVGKQTSLYLK